MVLKVPDPASVPLCGGATTAGGEDREGGSPAGRVSGMQFGKEWVSLTSFRYSEEAVESVQQIVASDFFLVCVRRWFSFM